jgi:hypothetical protein
MQMDVLRCKTPAMVRKEIGGHLLVYHLLRAAMAQAALAHGVGPRQVRLQGARQTLTAFHRLLAQMPSTAPRGHPAGPLRAARVQATPQAVSPPEGTAAASSRTLGNSCLKPRKCHSGRTLQYLCQLRKAEGGLSGMNTPQASDLVENLA